MKKLPHISLSRRPAVVLAAFVASVSLAGTTASVVAQDASGGDGPELAFNGYCRECHAFDQGDNRIGPTLYGVVGRKAGTVPGFAYSDSLKSSGITWNEKTLDQWIANPDAVIPGNTMGAIFSGLQDAKERAKIIAFLKSDTNKKPAGK